MKSIRTTPPVVIAPIRLRQKPIPKVWGGHALKRMFGFSLPPGLEVGESWLLYDRPGGSSELVDGSSDLGSLMKENATAILGQDVATGFDGRFPLMLKLIDAREQLSLQVHPDAAQARLDGDGGKHEASIVLRAGPDARMVSGLRRGVTREQLLAGVESESFESLVQTFRPRVGDCFDVPAGTVHAIGPDVLLFEVQQNSDLTYRLHDWGRQRSVDPARAAGIVRSSASMSPLSRARPIPGGGFLLTENPWFRVRRYQSTSSWTMATMSRFLTLTVVSGGGQLRWGSVRTESLDLLPGDTVLVPACLSNVELRADVSFDIIACDPGRRSSRDGVRAAG